MSSKKRNKNVTSENRLVQLNVHSMNKKAALLKDILQQRKLDFLTLCETWYHPNGCYMLPGYTYTNRPRLISAVFDTVCHTVLHERLRGWLDISGVVFEWFKFYLTAHYVCRENKSEPTLVQQGVCARAHFVWQIYVASWRHHSKV